MTAIATVRPPVSDARALTQRGVTLQGQGHHQEAVSLAATCHSQILAHYAGLYSRQILWVKEQATPCGAER